MSKEEALFLLPAGNVVFGSLSELPARSVDLSALNLTELVNGMLGRALKGSLFLKVQPGPFCPVASSLLDSVTWVRQVTPTSKLLPVQSGEGIDLPNSRPLKTPKIGGLPPFPEQALSQTQHTCWRF